MLQNWGCVLATVQFSNSILALFCFQLFKHKLFAINLKSIIRLILLVKLLYTHTTQIPCNAQGNFKFNKKHLHLIILNIMSVWGQTERYQLGETNTQGSTQYFTERISIQCIRFNFGSLVAWSVNTHLNVTQLLLFSGEFKSKFV